MSPGPDHVARAGQWHVPGGRAEVGTWWWVSRIVQRRCSAAQEASGTAQGPRWVSPEEREPPYERTNSGSTSPSPRVDTRPFSKPVSASWSRRGGGTSPHRHWAAGGEVAVLVGCRLGARDRTVGAGAVSPRGRCRPVGGRGRPRPVWRRDCQLRPGGNVPGPRPGQHAMPQAVRP